MLHDIDTEQANIPLAASVLFIIIAHLDSVCPWAMSDRYPHDVGDYIIVCPHNVKFFSIKMCW